MTAMAADLQDWAVARLGLERQTCRCAPVSGDASPRRYYRLVTAGASYILVHAPPATEKNVEFLAVRELLERAGVTVPVLHAADLERGFLLLGDLGDRLLLDALCDDTVDACYGAAFELLLRMGAIDPGDPAFPAYDHSLLSEELARFPQWFVQSLLDQPWDAAAQAAWEPLAAALVDSALEQPTVLVHRDFHSRNLMPQADGTLAVIDFQDAVIGPITYDLVSLLRDCYIRWPSQQVRDWALAYRRRLLAAERLAGVDEQQFLTWFDLMGLQRHIKVLGTFARLYLRDGKPAYLDDLPRVVDYVREILARHASQSDAICNFAAWFDAALLPAIGRQSRSARN
jgi:aminoglycoside/choline kinase family phosphotransferase